MSASHDQITPAAEPEAGGARLELLGFDLAAAFHESPLGIVILDREGRWQEAQAIRQSR